MSKVVVTGGAGFVGTNLCRKLAGLGYEVVCIDSLVGPRSRRNRETGLRNLVDFRQIDVRQSDELAKAFRGAEVVFHNAASKCTVSLDDPLEDLLVNAWGTWNVLRIAKGQKVKRVIHASTGSVTDIRSFYGTSKAAGEGYCRAWKSYGGPDYTILRYYHVYGPYQDESDKGGVVPLFIRRAHLGQPIRVFGGDQVRFFTHVDDVVKANLMAMEGECNHGPYSVVNEAYVTIDSLAGRVLMLTPESTSKVEREGHKAGDILFFPQPENRMMMRYRKFEDELPSVVAWYERDWKENGEAKWNS